MRIAVIGCGYVGLVTGACLAEAGHELICNDIDEGRIASLQAGRVPIYEPHLDAVIEETRGARRLTFTKSVGEAIRAGDAIFICVGTPPKETGEPDLSAIDNVARQIATEARSPKLVIEKSTVPAHTGRQLKRALSAYRRDGGATFHVVSNPEFLREGTAVEDFFHPDRIVVGVDEPGVAEQLREIYRPILERRFRCPVHAAACPPTAMPEFLVTTINSAELIKHASNSFLALKISYANVLADLCEKLGGNVDEVTRAVGMDPRIGPQSLKAGLGFGGFCLPKDIQAFIYLAKTVGVDFGMLKETERVNQQRVERLLEKARKALWVLKGKKIALLGLAFKAHTDDIRFSSAIEVLRRLIAEGAEVCACDPQAMDRTRVLFPDVKFERDPYETMRGADAVLLVTEWPEFRELDWERVARLMARPLILDGRNLLNPQRMRKLGFEYDSFGRPE
ncbi:MAG TPA: UDP-glucose/GDP-mannose dehydrogenase family protein [Candidatus Acidoferrales bacterium]